MSDNRDFLYTIPSKVLFDSRLQNIDLKIYMIVRSFQDTTHAAAYPSNAWIAERVSCHPRKVPQSLAKMEKLGHIRRFEEAGKRFIEISKPVHVVPDHPSEGATQDTPHALKGTPPCPKRHPPHALKGTQLYQSTITSKVINPLPPKGDVMSLDETNMIFDKLWEIYPLKKAKQKARGALIKLLKGKTRQEAEKLAKEIWGGLGACVKEHKAQTQLKEQGADIWVSALPYLTTWLNQGRWEDNYQSPDDILRSAKRKKSGLDLEAFESQWK